MWSSKALTVFSLSLGVPASAAARSTAAEEDKRLAAWFLTLTLVALAKADLSAPVARNKAS